MNRVARRLRPHVDSMLARADLALVRRSTLDRWVEDDKPSSAPSPLPAGAEAELRPDHPALADLEQRYRGHPAASPTQWSDEFVKSQVDLRHFRGDNAFVWQRRANTRPVNYALTTVYLRRHDPLGLLDRLEEDGLFGAYTHEVDGLVVSRDLLDSVSELNFLEEELGLSTLGRVGILDIGAGYGRLAHRTTTAFDGVTYLCTDAVALSTFLCDYYLRYRATTGTTVVPLDQVADALGTVSIDLAINVHSFSECPIDAIAWWIDVVVSHGVPNLMIVPNDGDRLLSVEATGERRDFRPLIESRGFRLTVERPKYAHSLAVQQHGIYPGHYFLFQR